MVGQYEELSCPFCYDGRISTLYFPSAVSVKRSSSRTFSGKKTVHKTSDMWLIQSGCSFCSKNKEEVEKELKKQGVI